MTFQIKAGLTALALVLAPLAAEAHHKSGHSNGGGNGHGRAEQSDRSGGGNAFGHHRNASEEGDEIDEGGEEEAAVTGRHSCAPGLANRSTPCVPPGQAARGVTTEQWIGAPTDGYTAGQSIADQDYGIIANTDQLGLDTSILPEGQSYALVGDTIVVVDDAGTIVSVVRRAAFPGQSNG